MKPRLKKLLAVSAVLAVLAAAAFFIHRLFGTICLFKGLTGYPCPGCGMTRAYISAAAGHFGDAFRWHPLFPLAPALAAAIAVYSFAKKPLPRKIAETALWALAAAFIIVWIIRLANGWR